MVFIIAQKAGKSESKDVEKDGKMAQITKMPKQCRSCENRISKNKQKRKD